MTDELGQQYTAFRTHYLPRLLKPQLKEVLKELGLRLNGNKPELAERLETHVSGLYRRAQGDHLKQAVQIVRQQLGEWYGTVPSPETLANRTSQNGSTSGAQQLPSPKRIKVKWSREPVQASSASRIPPPAALPAPAPSLGQLAGGAVNSAGASSKPITLFESSPFWNVELKISSPKVCDFRLPGNNFKLDFEIPAAQAAILQKGLTSPDPTTQVLVFCAPYDPPYMGLAVQWPAPCELWVNSEKIDLKRSIGLKGKPWTGQPADISRHCRLKHPGKQRVELRVGTLPAKINLPVPGPDKKLQRDHPTRYMLMVQIVRRISVSTIVEEIRRDKVIPKETIIALRQDAHADDDEIITTSNVPVPLKDPASMVRMALPARALTCKHIQCFDCATFFSLNQQVPTWCCPICNAYLPSGKSIIIDGYFMNILESVPESAELVEVRPDGSWYIPGEEGSEADAGHDAKVATTDGQMNIEEIVDLDSDVENNDSRSALASAPSSKSSPSRKPGMEVIDLTLSDDEAEPVAANKSSLPKPSPDAFRRHQVKAEAPDSQASLNVTSGNSGLSTQTAGSVPSGPLVNGSGGSTGHNPFTTSQQLTQHPPYASRQVPSSTQSARYPPVSPNRPVPSLSSQPTYSAINPPIPANPSSSRHTSANQSSSASPSRSLLNSPYLNNPNISPLLGAAGLSSTTYNPLSATYLPTLTQSHSNPITSTLPHSTSQHGTSSSNHPPTYQRFYSQNLGAYNTSQSGSASSSQTLNSNPPTLRPSATYYNGPPLPSSSLASHRQHPSQQYPPTYQIGGSSSVNPNSQLDASLANQFGVVDQQDPNSPETGNKRSASQAGLRQRTRP